MDMKKLVIGGRELPSPIILGPMAGVTDLPFRVICARRGAGLVCMEMVSAKAISYKNKNTTELLKVHPEEGALSLQLFGREPDLMAEVVKGLDLSRYMFLDINMGCPVPKIVNNGEGSALMKEPLLAGEIIEKIVKASSIPVTVKIRKGFDEGHVNAPEIAHIAKESGALAVAVHGRTRDQYYAGKADLDVIRAVKEAVDIPVIGNGDVTDASSALNMFEKTGCDGVMVARAARGNPWIIKDIDEELRTGKKPSGRDISMLRDTIREHAMLLCEFKGEVIAVKEMRKHAAWYTAGMPNSASFRVKVNDALTMDELFAAVDEMFDKVKTI